MILKNKSITNKDNFKEKNKTLKYNINVKMKKLQHKEKPRVIIQ